MEKTTVPQRIETIEKVISKASNVSVSDIRSKKRDKECVEARHAVWLIAHVYLHYTLTFLGKIYDRDHTTISSGIHKLKSQKVDQQIIAGVKKVCPEVFMNNMHGDPKTVENWQF